MNIDESSLQRTILVTMAGYPIVYARTLMQIGYEPIKPDEHGRLPNIVTYIKAIMNQRGYLSIYTGLYYYLPAACIKKSYNDSVSNAIGHTMEGKDRCSAKELIASCIRESYIRISSTVLTYPLVTLSVTYVSSTFFGNSEPFEYTLQALYKGIVPKLIVEVVMVWVTAISRRVFVDVFDEPLGYLVACRIPPYIVQSWLYPLNVVSTVMAENGISRMNPRFDDWRQCYSYLKAHNRHISGSSFIFRSIPTTKLYRRYF